MHSNKYNQTKYEQLLMKGNVSLARAVDVSLEPWRTEHTIPENELFTWQAEDGGGKVENDWINTGVETTKQQAVVPPLWALSLDVTH